MATPQGTAVSDDEWEKVPSPPKSSDDEWEAVGASEKEPPSDEEIESAYGKDVTPKMRNALKTGVAKMQPPTKFEKENERPYIENLGMREPGTKMQPQEYLGLPNTKLIKNAAGGAADIAKATAGAAYDIGLGEENPDTGEIEHGLGGIIGMNTKGEIHPLDRAGALTRKFVTDPAVAEWDKGNEEGGVAGAGHKLASALPVIGPWAAGEAERAGTGDVGGAAAETLGQIGAAGAAEKLPNIKDVAKKVAFGTPITDAGKLAAAQKQLLTVKKPAMSETEYAQRVNDVLPELQKIAKDAEQSGDKITTPREGVGAINKRIDQLESPIDHHLKTNPVAQSTVLHPDQYQVQIGQAVDEALGSRGEKLTPEEKIKAKQKVMEYIGEEPKSLGAAEDHRQRLNQDANDYYNSRPADRRAMNASDAEAIAQRAAANKIRDILYGDEATGTPGELEKAGINAVDSAGRQVPIREIRRTVGRLIDVRDHFEDAMVKAEETGDWSPFSKLFGGPSVAAGGLGLVAGTVAGGPFGAILGVLGGEGLKAWGDYLRSKNPNLNVKKAFENLGNVKEPPLTADITTRTPAGAALQPYGPQQQAFPAPIGPQLPAHIQGPPFEIQNGPGATVLAPRQTPQANWQTQVGLPPEIGFTPPAPKVEPIQPDTAWKLGNIGVSELPPAGRQLPAPVPEVNQLPLPGAAELAHPEMFPKEPIGVPAPRQTYRKPAGEPGAGQMARGFKGEMPPRVVGQTAEGGPMLEGQGLGKIGAPEVRPEVGKLGKIEVTPAEKLNEGDTFVDEKGDPRRITEITEDGTIKTADHTLRDYPKGEIKHLGEINSPKAQLARGGMMHPAGEPVEIYRGEEENVGKYDLGEIGDKAVEESTATPEEEAAAPKARMEPVVTPEEAINKLKERVKDRSHEGEERDYEVVPMGEVNPRTNYGTTFLLDDGSALVGDMGIRSHMQLAREVGHHLLNDAKAIRVVTPDAFELHGMPSEAQLGEMNRMFRELPREDRQNVHDPGYVYWDFYPEDVTGYSADASSPKHESAAGSFADFRRAVDKYYSPTTTAEISPNGSSVKLMENPLTVKGSGEGGRISTGDLLKAFNKFTKNALGKLTLEKAEPEEMVERAKSLAEDEAKYQLAQDNSGAAWYTKQMDEHDAIAQQMRPDLRDPAKLSLFKMAEAVLSSGQKPYGNFKAAIKAWDAYAKTGEFPGMNPETGKSWGPRGAAAYGNAMKMISDLVKEKGEQGASDWLLSEHPVSELRQYNKDVSGKMDSQRPGVIVLGEKRGPFAQNLHKIESAFTADMWVARTWNRWMGTAEIDPKSGEIASDAPRNDSERALMREAFDHTAKKLGLSTSALQAVLWYYEQALHNAHGVPKESWSFSDAARRAADEEAGIATTTKSGKAVKPKKAATLSPVKIGAS